MINYSDILLELSAKTRYINSGGCGHYVIILWNKLLKLGVPSKDICCRSLIYKHFDNTKEFNLFADKAISRKLKRYEHNNWRHLVLQVRYDNKLYLIDSSFCVQRCGIREGDIFYDGRIENRIGAKVKYSTIKSLMSVRNINWNDNFDKKQLPKIKRIVNKLVINK